MGATISEEQLMLSKIDEIKANLVAQFKDVWTTAEMQQEFEVLGFSHGLCVVRRLSDNAKGSLDFTHSPRFYFNFIKD